MDMPLTEAIRRMANIGYRAVELCAGHKPLDEERGYEDIVKQIKGVLAEHEISVSNLALNDIHLDRTTLCDGDDEAPEGIDIWGDPQYIERVRHYIKLAREFNCPSVSVSPGKKIPESVRSIQNSPITAGLNGIAKFARGLGVTVGISYGPGLIASKASDLETLLIKCRGLKIAFHVGNSHLACETPCNIAKEFKHRIKHIHIADVGCNDRPYLIPGAGEIEWISFFKTLRWIGYEGFVTVDLSSYRDIPDAAATRSYFYLSNIMDGLKRPMQKRPA